MNTCRDKRCEGFRRQWNLLFLLRQRAWTLRELSQALNVSGRTVRRDLSVFDALQFPLMKSDPDWKEVRWWLGAMAEWPRREDAPVRELRA